MEPFDLERALAGEPVVTRDGREVTEIYFFKTFEGTYPLVGIIDGEKCSYTTKGKNYSSKNSDFDLFMKPKVVEGWFNVYQDNEYGLIMSSSYPSEKEAKEKMINRHFEYIKTIKITNEI